MTKSKKTRTGNNRKKFTYLLLTKEEYDELNVERAIKILNNELTRETDPNRVINKKYHNKKVYAANTNGINQQTMKCASELTRATILSKDEIWDNSFTTDKRMINSKKASLILNLNGFAEYDPNGKYTLEQFNRYQNNAALTYTALFETFNVPYLYTTDYVLVDTFDERGLYLIMDIITQMN